MNLSPGALPVRQPAVSAAPMRGAFMVLALAAAACASPDPGQPGRDLFLVVTNASGNDVEVSLASESERSVTQGLASVPGCTASLVSFGGVGRRAQIAVDGREISDFSVPSGPGGHLVVALFVAPDGTLSAAPPMLRGELPVEPPFPAGCTP